MRRPAPPMNTPRTMRTIRGFTLVEVLVTLLVLSIGLLGIDKLLLVSSRANDSAYLRTQATSLAYSILDAMRSNRQTAAAGGYNSTSASVTNPGVTCSIASPCDGPTQAQYDLWQWKNALSSGLGPSGAGTIVTNSVTDPVTGATDVTATITVTWDDSVAQQTFGAAAGTVSLTLETML
jgi:type IV pilus assembly protein PilV